MKVTKETLKQIIKEEMNELFDKFDTPPTRKPSFPKVDRDMLADMADDVGPIIEKYTKKVMDKDVIMMGLAKMFGM